MKNAATILAAAFLGALISACLRNPDPAWAQTADGAGRESTGKVYILGTGGGQQNQNDLCWVMARVQPAKGKERTVLALYRAKRNGDYFDLEDVRMIDADLRVIELKGKEHDPETKFEAILKMLPKEEKEDIVPPKEKTK